LFSYGRLHSLAGKKFGPLHAVILIASVVAIHRTTRHLVHISLHHPVFE
jgi:hypothetical protein